MIIRAERPADIEQIAAVTAAAFADHPFSSDSERYIIEALHTAGALTLSLVAEIDGRVGGHIAFSPVTVSDGTNGWFGLGPLSVLPELQRRGIGAALVEAGLAAHKQKNAHGCVLVGEPGYYRRFGFTHYPELMHGGVPPEVFLALPFGVGVPRGTVVFQDGFLAHG